MQLREVQRIQFQPPQRGLRRRAHPGLRVMVRVKIAGAAQFRRHEETAPALPQEAPDQRLAAAIAIDVRGIEERHPGVGGGV